MAQMQLVRTIFPDLTLDRGRIHWENFLAVPTPVHQAGPHGLWFKREDAFAPLGYGGINGGKLRQAIWLFHRYVDAGGQAGLVSGASVKSPQLPMTSAVARHYGRRSLHVIAGNRRSAIKRDMVKMATWFGAEVTFSRNPYNPGLQAKAQRILAGPRRGDFYLEYGITLDHARHACASVEAFHRVVAEQASNIPAGIEDIVIAAGSCNSATSLLYGLALYPVPGLRTVHLVGIGPDRMHWIHERLAMIEQVSGINPIDQPHTVRHHDLHGTGYVSYQDEVPWYYGGIEFHPTYEGKLMAWMSDKHPELFGDTTLFWIIGSKPDMGVMHRRVPELGPVPTQVNEWSGD